MIKKRGQQTMGMPFGMMFDVARGIRLADQNFCEILDRKNYENEFRNFRFNLTCSAGGVL